MSLSSIAAGLVAGLTATRAAWGRLVARSVAAKRPSTLAEAARTASRMVMGRPQR